MTDIARDGPSRAERLSGTRHRRVATAPVATAQRRAILAALAESPAFLTAQALHDRLVASGHQVALTTVYRALRIYADLGDINRTRAADGTVLFRYGPDSDHRHYLRCRDCGYSVPVDSDPVEAWVARLAARHEFTDVDPAIEVLGICWSCRSQDGDPAP
ncbi:Fur family transcriptional regulator [Pseudonocardia alaniniphila]|uniref:Transcriptional repressor n=1 Tax=Pseudonocardia alaniniphila TaxID=75291 RepID=A0ABS9T725_9PSEU|nr:transcriptional repressor [Pseudonocardia alaniniphila]MCH6164324.1 transcriptional repressor [Pseudonocardia alaniniphila]